MGFLDKTLITELDNGVRLCYFHRPGTSVEMQLHIASGSIHEGKFLGGGVSHFLEHMAFQGCAGFPERSIAEKVNSLGGDLNAYTSYDRTCYRMQLPREFWRKPVWRAQRSSEASWTESVPGAWWQWMPWPLAAWLVWPPPCRFRMRGFLPVQGCLTIGGS